MKKTPHKRRSELGRRRLSRGGHGGNRFVSKSGVYKGKLPKHVKKFFIKIKGRKRTGYWSLITRKRISAYLIRQDPSIQVLRERFPKVFSLAKIQDAIDFYNQKDLSKGEREFFEKNYKELLSYIRDNQPSLLKEYNDNEIDSDFEIDDEKGVSNDDIDNLENVSRKRRKRRKKKKAITKLRVKKINRRRVAPARKKARQLRKRGFGMHRKKRAHR